MFTVSSQGEVIRTVALGLRHHDPTGNSAPDVTSYLLFRVMEVKIRTEYSQ